MIVTDKEYFLEKLLVEKLDLMINRMTGKGTDDNLINITGDEGQGKTNLATGICYYVSFVTGRSYNVNNIFFELDNLIKFASETKEQIIHWDEGALGGMSVHWWKKNQQKFIQLLMIARKKKHFIVICIPHFSKLNEYLIVDRSIALIHVYSRKNLQKGRFCYYTKKKKALLFEDWKRSHLKRYKKHKSFWGSFPKCMEKVFTPEQIEEYECKKDKAILDLGSDDKKVKEITERDITKKIFSILRVNMPEITLKEWAKGFGVSKRTLDRYSAEEKEKISKEI